MSLRTIIAIIATRKTHIYWSQISDLLGNGATTRSDIASYVLNFYNNIGEHFGFFCLFYRHQSQGQGIQLKVIIQIYESQKSFHLTLVKLFAIIMQYNLIILSYTIYPFFNSYTYNLLLNAVHSFLVL